MSLIQAEQDKLVMAQQIWMHNTLKTIIMKNTRDEPQNFKINSKSIRTEVLHRVNLILRQMLSEAALHLLEEREICLREICQTVIFHHYFS